MATLFGVAAILVGSFQSEVPSLWGDEIGSLMSAERSIPDLFAHQLGVWDAVHGLYYVILHFWIQAFGSSPFALRFLSAIAFGLAVAGAIALARMLANPRAAFLTGLVALFLPRLTEAATETKSQMLSCAFATWLTVFLIWLLKKSQQKWWLWIFYALAVAINIYLFMISGLIMLAHLVIVLFNAKARKAVWYWLPASAFGVLMALPVVYFGYLERNQISWIESSWVGFNTVVIEPWFLDVNYAVAAVYILIFLGGFLLLRKLSIRDKNKAISAVGVGLALSFAPAIFLISANQVSPIYIPRYLAMSATGVAFLIGYLLSRIHPIAGLIGVLILTGLAMPNYFYSRTLFAKNGDFASIAMLMDSRSSAGDAVVFDEESVMWPGMSTVKQAYPSSFARLNDVTFKQSFLSVSSPQDYHYDIPSIAGKLSSIQRVWLIEYRASGKPASKYGLRDLAKLGFTVTERFPNRYSVTYLLTRKLDPPRHQPGL
jgi:mannosyltransferase